MTLAHRSFSARKNRPNSAASSRRSRCRPSPCRLSLRRSRAPASARGAACRRSAPACLSARAGPSRHTPRSRARRTPSPSARPEAAASACRRSRRVRAACRLDVSDHAGSPGDRHHDLAAEEIGRRLTAPPCRDVVHLHPGHRREQRGEQMLSAAVARRCVVDLAGALLHIGDEFLDVFAGSAGFPTSTPGSRPISEIGVKSSTGSNGARGRAWRSLRWSATRAATCSRRAPPSRPARSRWWRLRQACSPRPLLAEALRQILRDDAHRPVDRAARGEGHDDPDRPRRVFLRVQRIGAERHGEDDRCEEAATNEAERVAH